MYQILKPYLWAAFLSTLPVTELRGAIPWVLSLYEAQPWLVMIAACIGNIIPAIILLWGLDLIAGIDDQESRNPVRRSINWVLDRTRRRTEKKVLQYGYLALLLFVAIPLPGTGAWTGAMAAWLFGLRKKPALLIISLGVILAGIIVTLITTGVINILV
ncbi:MAG: COG2426 family protein [Candidatus Komeilibacteria bacterium]